MKKIILLLLTALFILPAMPQTVGKKKIVTKPFSGIVAGGISEIKLIKGTEHVVILEAPERIIDKIKIKVSEEKLVISYNDIKIKNHESINILVTAPVINSINLSGAATLETVDVIDADSFKLNASGATEIGMELDVKNLAVKISGAANVKLKGKTVYEDIYASGASELKAGKLVADTAKVIASGASYVFVNVLHKIRYKESGVATVKFTGSPEIVMNSVKENRKVKVNVYGSINTSFNENNRNYADTVKIKVGGLDIEVVEDDTVTLKVGSHQLKINDEGIRWEAVKRPRFNGHWGGVETGINGYITENFNTKWGTKYDYLNLRYEKSWFLNLNLWEQNIAFNKNKTVGMITGVGISWNNYRFSNSTYLKTGENKLEGYYMVSKAYYDPDSTYTNQNLVKKSKLTNMYINIPVLFEFQSNAPTRNKRFHFNIGGIFGFRVQTHTKIYFNMANQEYKLQDPKTGEYLAGTWRTPNNSGRNIVKEQKSFYQPPFKFALRAGLGYRWLNLFTTYSLSRMFQNGRGPNLHPWTIGITLTGW